MLIPTTDADGILLDLRYASVDDLPGFAVRRHRGRAPGGGATRPMARFAAALALSVALAGCASGAEPTTFAVPRAAAAEIRMTCPPGTFIGTMTVDCPRPLPRAATVQ